MADHDDADRIRHSLTFVSAIVREMMPSGQKPIPSHPQGFNLLVRPVSNTCRICNLPGHSSPNIQNSAACRTALLSGFWEGVASHILSLYQNHERFHKAIQDSKSTYAMRLDAGAPKVGGLEDVLVERVTCAWLKFVAHFGRIRAKVNAILTTGEVGRYEEVEKEVNGVLLGELTLSDLYKRDQ